MEGVKYPVIQCGYDFKGKSVYLNDCCFHDLFESDLNEWAGMGLAIIGNVVKAVQQKLVPVGARLWLRIKFHAGDKGKALPWPGMPTDDKNLPGGFFLDHSKLPFDYAMFVGENGDIKKRIDRLELMRRIREVWVPHLFELSLEKV